MNLPCGTTLGTAKQQLSITRLYGPNPALLKPKAVIWEQTLASKSVGRLRITIQKGIVALRILIHELHGFLPLCSFYPSKNNCPTGHIIYDTALELRLHLVILIN